MVRNKQLQHRDYNPSAVAEKGQLFGLPFSYDNARHIVIPIPWDATSSFKTGSSANVDAIIHASAQIDLGHPFLGDYWEAGIAIMNSDPYIKEQNHSASPLAAQVFSNLESGKPAPEFEMQELNRISQNVHDRIQAQCMKVLNDGKTLCVLGGEHSVTAGAFSAAAGHYLAKNPTATIGLLVIDAHMDLRHHYAGMTHSHASVMRRILDTQPSISNCTQVGIRDFCEEELTYANSHPDRIHIHTDYDIFRVLDSGQSWALYCQTIVSQLPDAIYLSIDIDGLEPSLCPNTGTPVPGGLSYNHVMTLLHTLDNANKTIIGTDLVEVVTADVSGNCINANVASRLLYTILGLQRLQRTHV